MEPRPRSGTAGAPAVLYSPAQNHGQSGKRMSGALRSIVVRLGEDLAA